MTFFFWPTAPPFSPRKGFLCLLSPSIAFPSFPFPLRTFSSAFHSVSSSRRPFPTPPSSSEKKVPNRPSPLRRSFGLGPELSPFSSEEWTIFQQHCFFFFLPRPRSDPRAAQTFESMARFLIRRPLFSDVFCRLFLELYFLLSSSLFFFFW